MQLNPTDKKLLDRLQQGLPLAADPYGIIAAELGLFREDIPKRIKALQEAGYIRRLGGVFDSGKMGYHSLLVGCLAPEEDLPSLAAHLNQEPGVTHSYLRQGRLNLWFTLTMPSADAIEDFLLKLTAKFPESKLYRFPRQKNFKLKVFFPMEESI